MKISIIIPNYNGQKLLEKNLAEVEKLKTDEILVIDDASTDDSLRYFSEKHPSIKVIKNSKNLGFIKSVNKGVKESIGDLVILLNNDVAPSGNFIDVVSKYFDNPKVFAVSFNEPNWSYAKGQFIKGFIEHSPGPKTDIPHISLWASGGSAIFRKSIWEKLKGFDEVYEPFYWEDIDLSYRAWKSGYEVWWEPKAVVYHNHETTISSHFSKKFIDEISERNRLLFIWKNISDKNFLIEHKKYLLEKLMRVGYWKPFLRAIVRKSQIKKEIYKIKDSEIFEKFK